LKINSLKIRVLFWFGSISIVILFLFSFAFYYFFKQNIHLKLQTQLYEQAKQLQDEILSGTSLQKLIQDPRLQNYEVAIVKKNKIIDKSKNFMLKNSVYYFQHKERFFMLESEKYVKGVYILTLKRPMQGKLIIMTHALNNMVEDVEDTLLTLIPMLLLILLFLGVKLIDKILIPITSITQTTRKISINHFSSTIPLPQNEDEIKDLVVSFNAMIDRLKEGVDNLDRFNSDVSHELKTPLTVIKGEVEVSLRKVREPEAYIKSMQTILYETGEMEKVVEDLLLLTKYSKDTIEQTFDKCQVDAIVLNILEKYDAALKDKQLNLKIEKLEPIVIKANPLLLSTLFANLIDNAIKYTPEHGNITVSLYKKDKIHFVIKDEGMGIPKEKVSKITDRFYRVDESRNKKIKGFGLGLSIVKNSVELHGGEMKIVSVLGKGTTVHVIL